MFNIERVSIQRLANTLSRVMEAQCPSLVVVHDADRPRLETADERLIQVRIVVLFHHSMIPPIFCCRGRDVRPVDNRFFNRTERTALRNRRSAVRSHDLPRCDGSTLVRWGSTVVRERRHRRPCLRRSAAGVLGPSGRGSPGTIRCRRSSRAAALTREIPPRR